LPVGDELAIGALGLFGHLLLAGAHVLERIAGGAALLAAPGGQAGLRSSARSFLAVSEGRAKE
jgi:hypothetical protein